MRPLSLSRSPHARPREREMSFLPIRAASARKIIKSNSLADFVFSRKKLQNLPNRFSWVCEDHGTSYGTVRATPRKHATAVGAGAPCPACNSGDEAHRPELPEGYASFLDKHPWTN
jgi:hypothetical protein